MYTNAFTTAIVNIANSNNNVCSDVLDKTMSGNTHIILEEK